MPSDQLLALITFAIVGSFTPGPNTTLATVTAANHGFRAAVPFMLGVPFGFGSLLAAGSLGVAGLLIANPLLAQIIKWVGIGYLLYIAFHVAGAGAAAERTLARPLNFWQAAAFQYANPKAWMLAAATAATFVSGGPSATRTAIIIIVFGTAAFVSLVAWAGAGAALRQWLAVGRRLRAFNLLMGALLALTAVWMVFV